MILARQTRLCLTVGAFAIGSSSGLVRRDGESLGTVGVAFSPGTITVDVWWLYASNLILRAGH